MSDKTNCRTPNSRGTTNIPTWKFALLQAAIRDAVEAAGPEGLLFSELSEAVGQRLSSDDRSRLGSLGWHTTTVKLELEVRGEIEKIDNNGPQRLIVSKT